MVSIMLSGGSVGVGMHRVPSGYFSPLVSSQRFGQGGSSLKSDHSQPRSVDQEIAHSCKKMVDSLVRKVLKSLPDEIDYRNMDAVKPHFNRMIVRELTPETIGKVKKLDITPRQFFDLIITEINIVLCFGDISNQRGIIIKLIRNCTKAHDLGQLWIKAVVLPRFNKLLYKFNKPSSISLESQIAKMHLDLQPCIEALISKAKEQIISDAQINIVKAMAHNSDLNIKEEAAFIIYDLLNTHASEQDELRQMEGRNKELFNFILIIALETLLPPFDISFMRLMDRATRLDESKARVIEPLQPKIEVTKPPVKSLNDNEPETKEEKKELLEEPVIVTWIKICALPHMKELMDHLDFYYPGAIDREIEPSRFRKTQNK